MSNYIRLFALAILFAAGIFCGTSIQTLAPAQEKEKPEAKPEAQPSSVSVDPLPLFRGDTE